MKTNKLNIATEHNHNNYTLAENEREAIKVVLAKLAERTNALYAEAEKDVAAILEGVVFEKRGERLIVNRTVTAKAVEVFHETPNFFTVTDTNNATLFVNLG